MRLVERNVEKMDMKKASNRPANFTLIALAPHRPVDVEECHGKNMKTIPRRRKRLVGAREHKGHDLCV